MQRQEKLEAEESIQAKCDTCEAEEPIQRLADGTAQAQPDLENRLNASQGGGSALPDDVRSFIEPRFGADFSQVRVHTGSDAVQMNRELNAQAFTHKQSVYFGAGKAPANDALTAHELTHVVQQTGGVHAESIKLSILNSAAPQSAKSLMLQLKHVPIDDAVSNFKKVVTPSNETAGSLTLVNSGQFYWTTQISFAIRQQINILRFIPAVDEWQKLLNELDQAADPTRFDQAAQDREKIKRKVSSIRQRAQKGDPIAITLLPLLLNIEPLLKPAPMPGKDDLETGKHIYDKLWNLLQKGDQVPSLTPYQSIPTLQAIGTWENQACGFTKSQLANRFIRKGGAKKANPDATRGSSTRVSTSFAKSAVRDMRPISPDNHRLGDVLIQNGVAGAVPKMQAALDDGWLLSTRILSGVDYGDGEAAKLFDKQAAVGKAPKQPQGSPGEPPKEHFILIIGYDLPNKFVFWDPDTASSHLYGGGFGLLFFQGGKLSTAENNADLAVDLNGYDSKGQHRYQVIELASQ